ncbi:regulatory protein GemA [Segnochrobactrum spirostomi]|uniref:Regulatory protein GemA n=1 Tax=Segnochrobactrum spirostomi TaxID=2608987 RepID=A0A6A7Y7U6_9HYPH|nr:regulatory protein GemA [Segnochrobactrum spirostomi]MQT14407.1 regulatory protein GemA [Segnochrobactrum spirostomi]
MKASAGQIAAIHTIAKRIGMTDDDRRTVMRGLTGCETSRDLTAFQASKFIDELNRLGAPATKVDARPDGALRLSGPYAPVCRALWLSGYNLGLVRDRTDRALVTFAKRQTGIDHLDWVRRPADGKRVIEALKAWLERAGGVAWPDCHNPSARARKLSIVEAQARLLGLPAESLDAYRDSELDVLIAERGRTIRKRQAP